MARKNALDEIATSSSLLEQELLGDAPKPAPSAVAAQYRGLLKSSTDQTLKKVDLLTGEEACRFLGIPVRPYCHVEAGVRGDYYRINQRFKGLFEEWLTDPHEAGMRTPDNGFWKNICIRAWRYDDIEDFGEDGMTIIGKELKPIMVGDTQVNGRYEAPYLHGTQLAVFAPNLQPIKSNHATKYFVQLVSVNVTADMKNYVETLNYGR
jgi:hypothetical protein